MLLANVPLALALAWSSHLVYTTITSSLRQSCNTAPCCQSPSCSPLASDCSSSRRSSVSSTSSLGSEAKPEVERVRHREVTQHNAHAQARTLSGCADCMLTECHRDGQVEKLLRAVADGDVEMVRVGFSTSSPGYCPYFSLSVMKYIIQQSSTIFPLSLKYNIHIVDT